MMAPGRHNASRRARAQFLAALTFLLAHGGAAAVADLEENSRHHASIAGHVTSDPPLLLTATRELASARVLPEPRQEPATSVTLTIDRLLAAHRAYIDTDPDRFAAITHLASAAVFGRRELLAPLAERSRRTRQTAYRHLVALHDAKLIAQPQNDLQATADLLVNGATGIELSHLIEPDIASRDTAYRELSRTIQARLTKRA